MHAVIGDNGATRRSSAIVSIVRADAMRGNGGRDGNSPSGSRTSDRSMRSA